MSLGVRVAIAACAVLGLCAAPAGAAFELGSQCGTQGSGDGQFESPEGIGAGVTNDVYVGDTGNDRIQRFDADGAFMGKWGSFGGTNGRFSRPVGVAVDLGGNVYVADSGNNRIQKFTAIGTFISKFGTGGSGNGQFNNPTGVAVDQTGNVYVIDSGNHRVQKFDSAGNFIATWGTGPSSATGNFDTPAGIAVDFLGNVYVTDAGNNRVQKFDSNGGFITTWGSSGTATGQFNNPYGVAVDNGGEVYVADQSNHRIQVFAATGMFLDEFGTQGSAGGQFQSPAGVAVDGSGGVYVLDTGNHRVQKLTADTSAIVIRKDAQPDDPQDFDFTTGGGLSPASFQLEDEGVDCAGLSPSRTFAVDPGSGYSVSETVPTGWDLDSATCDDGSPPSNIDVSAGEIVTCTFVNRKRGRIVIVQDSLPDHPQDFGYSAGPGLTPSTFTLDDDGNDANGVSSTQVIDNVAPGSGYSVSQTSTGGWSAADATCSDGSSPSNIDVSSAETVTCTFSNLAPTAGRLIVVKDTQPNDGFDFSFSVTGGSGTANFQLDDDGTNSNPLSNSRTLVLVAPAAYSVSETTQSSHTLASATCSDGSPVSNVDLAAGETVTCTFVNQRNGTVNIVKDAQPDDPQDFEFTMGGGLSPTNFVLDDDNDTSFGSPRNNRAVGGPPGSGYSITETPVNGWELTSAVCSDGSPITNIDLSPGEFVTCTFTNVKRFHVRPRGATPLITSLVPAFQPCVSPNRMHGPPLAHPSCNPPVHHSNTVTPGIGDGSPALAKSEGRVRLDVITGAPGGLDDSDVRITFVLTNLMNKPSLSDYTGELRASTGVRLTDRAEINNSYTVQDFVFGFTVPCAATADTTLGGDCRLFTTADAVLPGAIPEGLRSVWGLNQIRVHDGGPDGDADTAGDNSLLAVQGLFVP